ncbi:hypothetical protein RA263_10715 [Pseudomonas syringae pv. tagetis]|uniref:Uncharacterized protein n=1 Tax=Pseudomonas syringae pv. tagetis TaxID=129140 RepID=A0ABW7NKP0_9PSED|nr:hypothetical protein [Pseudomonas syringae group genomosp. 7]UNB71041.1 hypothetical protein MME58_12785 [Pseudomonas syringae pv. tagetis]
MDEEVAAIVVDNESGSDQIGNESRPASQEKPASPKSYAKVGANGIVIAIKDISGPPPSPDWKPCKADTKVGSKY